jgi:hypothetical protein
MDEITRRVIEANAIRTAAHALPSYENSGYFSDWLFARANEIEAGKKVNWFALFPHEEELFEDGS